jgi:osmotically-inducible protein OsmY
MPNTTLQQAVCDELAADPKIDASAIAVSADDQGVVTLQGTVGSPRQKREAGRDAQRVQGVHEVKNELQVRILIGDRRDDAELRGAVLQALRLDSMVPASIDAKVDNGLVTLTGRAKWHYERDEAEFIAGNVRGVRSVRSEIVLEPEPNAEDIEQSIKDKFMRNATLDADSITVESMNGTVVLSGFVSSWAEREAALNAAWSARGVTGVKDRLVIRD